MKGRINSKATLSLFLIAFILLILTHNEFQALSAENAISYNQKGWEYLNNGNTLKAIVNFKQALYKNSRYKEAMLGLGKAYLKTEAYEEALKLFDEAQRIDRNSQDALNGMGFTMIGMGRYNEALKFLKKPLRSPTTTSTPITG
jgi:Tfp pilus assembly protein PilF